MEEQVRKRGSKVGGTMCWRGRATNLGGVGAAGGVAASGRDLHARAHLLLRVGGHGHAHLHLNLLRHRLAHVDLGHAFLTSHDRDANGHLLLLLHVLRHALRDCAQLLADDGHAHGDLALIVDGVQAVIAAAHFLVHHDDLRLGHRDLDITPLGDFRRARNCAARRVDAARVAAAGVGVGLTVVRWR